MVITTFLPDLEILPPTSNPIVNDLLEKVKIKTKTKWQVVENTTTIIPEWWKIWKSEERKITYSLFMYNQYECQWKLVNCPDKNSRSEECRRTANFIAGYLQGILDGIKFQEMKNGIVQVPD